MLLDLKAAFHQGPVRLAAERESQPAVLSDCPIALHHTSAQAEDRGQQMANLLTHGVDTAKTNSARQVDMRIRKKAGINQHVLVF